MYKQDLEQTLLGIDEEAELEIGPRDDRPSVVLVGGGAFMLNDVTNRSVTHDIDVFEADRCLREIPLLWRLVEISMGLPAPVPGRRRL